MRAFGLVAAATLSAAANAFPTHGSRNDVIALQAMHDYAACVVDRSPQRATAMLDRDFRDASTVRAFYDYAREHGACLRGQAMMASYDLLRGAMAERLLERRYGKHLGDATVADLEHPVTATSPVSAASLCVVIEAPTETAALFDTDPSTEAEAAAANTLMTKLADCVPSGQKFALNRPALRADLALAAYRLTRNNAAATPAARGN